MSKKKFKIVLAINLTISLVTTTIACLIFENTVITNEIAMGQMSNSNEAYLLMEYYTKIRNLTFTSWGIINTIILGLTIYSIYKITKDEGEI